MTTTTTAVPDIPDEVYAAAELAANAEVHSGTEWHAPIYAAVRAAITTLLADRIVAALPKPDDTDNEGDPLWDLGGKQAVIGYADAGGHPMVRLPDGEDEAAEWVELYAPVLLAATRESRRLAAEYKADLEGATR